MKRQMLSDRSDTRRRFGGRIRLRGGGDRLRPGGRRLDSCLRRLGRRAVGAVIGRGARVAGRSLVPKRPVVERFGLQWFDAGRSRARRHGSRLCFPCGDDALAGELAGFRCRRDGGTTMVFGCEQRAVGARRVLVLGLAGGRGDMVIVRSRLLLRRQLRRRSAGAAVEAHPRDRRVVDHGLVVDVGDGDAAEIVEGTAINSNRAKHLSGALSLHPGNAMPTRKGHTDLMWRVARAA
jgi:hypothetical protein